MPMNYNEHLETYVGKGGGAQALFDPTDFSTAVVSGESKLNDSIYMILSTRKGERFFMPSFGSELHKVIFEQNEFMLEDMVTLYVTQALAEWEPRISVVGVTVGTVTEGNVLPVDIAYRIQNTNIVYNYVYPLNLANAETGEVEIHDIV